MATVVFGLLNYTSISTAESTTGWTNFDTLDPDFAKEGGNAITDQLRSDGEEAYFDNGSAPITGAGKHVRWWINTINKAYMEPEANGGYEFLMYDGVASEYRTMFGSDTYGGGWVNYVVDVELFTTLTLANIQRWGLRIQHTATAKNIDNTWVDYIRYLDGYYITGGTSGDELTLALIAARDVDDGAGTLRGYGVVSEIDGVYYCTGKLTIGNSTTTTYFLMDADVMVFSDNPVATGFYEIAADGTVADITITDSVIRAASSTTNLRFVLDMSNTSVSVSITSTVFLYSSTITFASGQTATGNTFNDCGVITHGGADMSGSIVKNYEGTADTSGVVYNIAVDPDGEMDNMQFIKGTASTHAIEFGITSPLSMTLRGIDFSGYNAADGQTDSALHIKRTAGTVEIALIGCSGNIKYKSDGATVVLTASKSATFTPVQNGSAFTITKDSDNSILKDVATVTGGEVVYSYDGALDGTATTVHIIEAGQIPIDFSWTVAEGTVPIQQVTDRVYSNP